MTIEDEVVRKAPLFTALDDAAAVSLRASMDSVKIGKGGILFKEGDSGSHGFRCGPSELLLRRSRDRALNLTAQGSIITLRFLWRHRVLLVRSVL